MTRQVDRRSFLKAGGLGVAAVTGGAVLSGCRDGQSDAEDSWREETDIVVIGYGGGGACAAVEAADHGANVIVVEEAAIPGGSTRLCEGVIYAGGGTSLQTAAGFNDSKEDFYNYWTHVTRGGVNIRLVRRMIESSADNFRWLQNLGLEYPVQVHDEPGQPIPEHGLYYSGAEQDHTHIAPSVPRGHACTGKGPALFGALQREVERRDGIKVHLQTPCREILLASNGDVAGVRVERDGELLAIRARKAVILATGHFTRNESLLAFYAPGAQGGIPLAEPNAFGQGQVMADEVGATLRNMSMVGQFVIGPDYATQAYGIYVNRRGRRFVNESGLHGIKGHALFKQPGKEGWVIFDSSLQQLTGERPEFSADSIAVLADQLQIDPLLLADTIEDYNGYVALGRDPEFGKQAAYLRPLVAAPFHAKKLQRMTLTVGGVAINEHAQAVNRKGRPAPRRLYAAGMVSAGMIGEIYPGSGANIATLVYTGRTAGKHAAMRSTASEGELNADQQTVV